MNTPVTSKTPISNAQLAELLKCLSFTQIKPIPPHLLALDLPSFEGLRDLLTQRLTASTEVEHELSRKDQLGLASDLKKELRGHDLDKPQRDLIKGFETYRFPKDFLRGSWETHKARGDERRIGCITISLDRFLPPDVDEPIDAALAGIGAVFNYLTHHNTWPMDVDDARHIFWLITQQLVGQRHENPAMLCGKNLMLVIGKPENMGDHVPHVARDELLTLSEQMKEIDRDYPGWIIQSDPWDDN